MVIYLIWKNKLLFKPLMELLLLLAEYCYFLDTFGWGGVVACDPNRAKKQRRTLFRPLEKEFVS